MSTDQTDQPSAQPSLPVDNGINGELNGNNIGKIIETKFPFGMQTS